MLKKKFSSIAALLMLSVLFCGRVAWSQAAPSATLQGDAAHPAQTEGWVETKLYFGLGPAGDARKGVTEVEWRDFLDKEVTPRFPAGLSVVDVYGQWQGKTGPNMTANTGAHPSRIRSKMLIIDYPGSAENAAKIEAIRVAWKLQTHDQSVLKVTQPVDVSF